MARELRPVRDSISTRGRRPLKTNVLSSAVAVQMGWLCPGRFPQLGRDGGISRKHTIRLDGRRGGSPPRTRVLRPRVAGSSPLTVASDDSVLAEGLLN